MTAWIVLRRATAVAALLLLSPTTAQAASDTDPMLCTYCKEWSVPQQPFNIYGNTWYVGTRELSAVLITSPQGHILLDGTLSQAAPQIAANITRLGFRLTDVKLILNSHAHFDHASGIAALQRMSGARVAASPSGAQALRNGTVGADDPFFETVTPRRYPKVAQVEEVSDGQVLQIGPLSVVAHATPGHTPGSTTWSWLSCQDQRCLNIVYADSLSPISEDGFRFRGGPGHADVSASFRASIAKVAALPCDIIISVHPGLTDVMDKHAGQTPRHNPFIDSNGCRAYAAEADEALTKRLAHE